MKILNHVSSFQDGENFTFPPSSQSPSRNHLSRLSRKLGNVAWRLSLDLNVKRMLFDEYYGTFKAEVCTTPAFLVVLWSNELAKLRRWEFVRHKPGSKSIYSWFRWKTLCLKRWICGLCLLSFVVCRFLYKQVNIPVFPSLWRSRASVVLIYGVVIDFHVLSSDV